MELPVHITFLKCFFVLHHLKAAVGRIEQTAARDVLELFNLKDNSPRAPSVPLPHPQGALTDAGCQSIRALVVHPS